MEFRSFFFIDVRSPAGLEPFPYTAVMLRLSRLHFVCVTCR